MGEYTIKNLQDVLNGRIGKNLKISDFKMKALTSHGDNFGSTMLQLDVTLKNENDDIEEEIHAVAKMIPESEVMRKMFNIQVTFKNEIAMYDTIVPVLQDFQRENGVGHVIDCFPEFYGARINLGEENGIVDDNAVLILENLKTKGYQIVDRFSGFDLETAQLILKDLAAFHAIPLALKLKNPEVFDKKIRPYLAPFQPPSMPQQKEWDSMVLEIFQDSDKCLPWVPKIENIFNNIKEIRDAPPREPFSTMTHGDMWVNNMMVKFQNDVPVHNKLIDFQVCDYKSPATDLFFFLFTSVQLSVLEDNLDSLIEFYHKHFISHLKTLECDVTAFSLSRFLEEIKAATVAEFSHTTFMTLFVVFRRAVLGSIDPEESSGPDLKTLKENLDLMGIEKVRYMVQACGKRGWL